MMRSSLLRKLLGLVLLSTLAALVLAMAGLLAYDLRLYRQNWTSDLDTQAELIGRTSAAALTFDDARELRESLGLLRYRPKVQAAAVYNARGKPVASYARDAGIDLPQFPESDGVRVEGDAVTVFKRIVEGREILGTVYLRADYDFYQRLFGYLGIAAVVACVALGAAYLLSRPLQRAVAEPLLAIIRVAQEVTDKRNFSLRAEKLSRDEVGQLAEAFNTMLAEIGRATRELEASNRVLATEVAERSRAEGEIRRLNAELESRVRERTAQLEYSNSELEAFCHTVSHDLRGPLRSIDGFSQALLEDFPADVPEEAKRYLARIRTATLRMSQLIEDLLNLSKVSRTELDRAEVDVGELARQVAADLQAREPERKVEMNVWDGMRAYADARLLRAALENLIGNAWKFTSKVPQARIEVGQMRDGERRVFFVRDNGAGFDMAFANKLFGAFQRLHGVNEFAGTGIGLATVQRILHRHGGDVWADAQVGRGAVFYFSLEPGGAAAGPKK
jgi:signal transduction histidine kinase